MGRVFFFLSESFRALRRSAAPSVAAIVTIVITTLLLGVLVPVLHASSAKTNEVRDQIGLRVFLYRDASQVQRDQLEKRLNALPHVTGAEYCSPVCAKKELPVPPARRPRVGHQGAQLQPAAAVVQHLARRPGQPRGRPRLAAAHERLGQADADQPGDRPADRREPRGREQDPRGHRRRQDRPAGDRGPAADRLAAAGREHDPALDLRPPARGRGDEPGRRDQLVHPLAVHDRGRHRRPHGRGNRGRHTSTRQGHHRGSAGKRLRTRGQPLDHGLRSPGRDARRQPRCSSRRSAAASRCAASCKV